MSPIFRGRPVFVSLLIDMSGSLQGQEVKVFSVQKIILESLRRSAACNNGTLYFSQLCFADRPHRMHEFYPMHFRGQDKIVALTPSNYTPAGMTALYDTIVQAVKDMEVQLDYAKQRGLSGEARIAIITDGEDTCSQASSADARAAIARLRATEQLRSSVVFGLIGPEFTNEKLSQLKEDINFSMAIGIPLDSVDFQREIRQLFRY